MEGDVHHSPNRGPHASYVTKGQKWSERQGCRYEAVVSNDVCKCDSIGEPWALSKTELPNLETIDVSAVGDDILGLNHNVFAASRDVMEDISALLKQNKPSPRLAQISCSTRTTGASAILEIRTLVDQI